MTTSKDRAFVSRVYDDEEWADPEYEQAVSFIEESLPFLKPCVLIATAVGFVFLAGSAPSQERAESELHAAVIFDAHGGARSAAAMTLGRRDDDGRFASPRSACGVANGSASADCSRQDLALGVRHCRSCRVTEQVVRSLDLGPANPMMPAERANRSQLQWCASRRPPGHTAFFRTQHSSSGLSYADRVCAGSPLRPVPASSASSARACHVRLSSQPSLHRLRITSTEARARGSIHEAHPDPREWQPLTAWSQAIAEAAAAVGLTHAAFRIAIRSGQLVHR